MSNYFDHLFYELLRKLRFSKTRLISAGAIQRELVPVTSTYDAVYDCTVRVLRDHFLKTV